jgi:hypothetical protein
MSSRRRGGARRMRNDARLLRDHASTIFESEDSDRRRPGAGRGQPAAGRCFDRAGQRGHDVRPPRRDTPDAVHASARIGSVARLRRCNRASRAVGQPDLVRPTRDVLLGLAASAPCGLAALSELSRRASCPGPYPSTLALLHRRAIFRRHGPSPLRAHRAHAWVTTVDAAESVPKPTP